MGAEIRARIANIRSMAGCRAVRPACGRRRRALIASAMGQGQKGKSPSEVRAERQRAALRENLRRRKAQARGRARVERSPVGEGEAPPEGKNER
jgi:hypothetical protein